MQVTAYFLTTQRSATNMCGIQVGADTVSRLRAKVHGADATRHMLHMVIMSN